MRIAERQRLGWVLVLVALMGAPIMLSPSAARAIDVGEPAPGFTLASTTGGDISLGDFRGKRFVLLEFYGADFAPT
jgi:peroxiredoxin